MTPTLVIACLTVSVIADSIRNLCDVRMLNQVQHDAGDAAWRSFVRTDVIRLRG